ncbi:MAG: alpha-glucan family phosphorylase [Gemmatimonadales bacterium]|nr:alpha-glucan family phosphorylase [Gemmatimonadales bacterium]
MDASKTAPLLAPPEPRIPYLPARVEGLATLAMNLWWSWHRDARELFAAIDELRWHRTRHNPLELLRQVDPARIATCASDRHFLQKYDEVMARMQRDLDNGHLWFPGRFPELKRPVAYFCAEFGLHNSVPIYSGGLGVLAGDHIKAASDLGVPMVGVGLLYLNGYFDQRLSVEGWQQDSDEEFDLATTPLVPVTAANGEPFLTAVVTSGRPVVVRAWRMMVGRVPVYLLDANLPQNHPDDRLLLTKLYAGGPALRLRQEWILGVGGVRVLRAMGIDPAIFHANEGHAAFMFVERVREQVLLGKSFADAVAEVRAGSLFTTHTPVPAGHDIFGLEELEKVTGPVWEQLGCDRETFHRIGRHPQQPGTFHMTVCALRLSSRANGVSRRHGAVSRQLWAHLWSERPAETVPIGHITNGVHLETWMAGPVIRLLDDHLGQGWRDRTGDPAMWDQVLTLDHERLWAAHVHLKRLLVRSAREEARRRFATQLKQAVQVVGAGTLLDPSVLTIGFARRFATYKRANLMFADTERLRRLLTDPYRPVQLIFAGKAHPADTPGKEVLQKVYQFTRDPAFEGRVAFLEDYDMHLAHLLVQGVDLWMNLPRVPLEASGTSGMKAGLNGVPQLSTIDGWWQEGYDGLNGWAIAPGAGGDDAATDLQDVTRLYQLLEDQVVPLYYTRDGRDIPVGWVEKMRHALRQAGAKFTARRMVEEYVHEHYVPAMRRDPLHDQPPTA